MSSMLDKIQLALDLGNAVITAREQAGLTATEVARRAGRSRDILHRLERGDDVTVAALLDILRGLGWAIRLEPAGAPTLDEMQRRFAGDEPERESDAA
jgi:HTH-type transcriptional regulator / antitoxin HipB